MFDWLISIFDVIVGYFQDIFTFIGNIFNSIANFIESLQSGLEWISGIALFFPSFQIITSAVILAFGLTIALKVLGR